MNPLHALLKDNSDPSDTRHDMLTAEEVVAIVEALNAEIVIGRMVETYNRAHPERKEAHP